MRASSSLRGMLASVRLHHTVVERQVSLGKHLGWTLCRVNSREISALPLRKVAVGTGSTDGACDLSSAVTEPYGFLILSGGHFLVSEVKAHRRSSPKSFPGFRSCRSFRASKAGPATGSNGCAVLLAFWWCHCGAALSARVTLALSQESGIYS